MVRTTARYGRTAGMLAVVVVLLGACGDAQDPGTDDGTPTTPATAPATAEPTGPATLDPTTPGEGTEPPAGYPAQVGAAIADLAAHLSVPAEEVTVVSFEEVTWPDGSLGCPEPGMSYTQALVPGSRLVLAADGAEHAYHGGSGGDLVRCDRTPQLPADAG